MAKIQRFFRISPVVSAGQVYNDLQAHYGSVCKQCGKMHLPVLSADNGPYDAILDALALQLWERKLKTGNIPQELFTQTSGDLLKTLDEGLGDKSFDIFDGRNLLKAYYQQNITAFSAAKSLTQMNYMRSLMADAKDFTDFRNKVLTAGIEFNINWLRTEYDTFTAAAQMGKLWDDYTAAGVEVFEFTTVGDERVRATHAALDGLTFRKDATFVKRVWPPLDWNCRCSVIPGIDAKIKEQTAAESLVHDAAANKQFHFHAGLDKVLVDDDHAYWGAYNSAKNANVKKQLDYKKNYGLPTVEHLYKQIAFPARIEMASEEEYLKWWKDMVNIERSDDFQLKDKTGVHVLFDSSSTPGNNKTASAYFKEHILLKTAEKRWSYAANLVDVITDSDEVWSVRQNNKLNRWYIKYFDDAVIGIIVKDKDGVMVADSMYELTKERATEVRRGELLFIKR